jgi:hypothetical protein
MLVSVFVIDQNCISNRSELYEKALQIIVGRADKGRGGLSPADQSMLFEHLQKLASKSHQRDSDRRIFTGKDAKGWVGIDGWTSIEKAMHAGVLPLLVHMGRNAHDQNEYRFGHLSYQEYLAGRAYYQELTAAQFSTDTLVQLFGEYPLNAFADVKQHVLLLLLAGILSREQRAMFLMGMCGWQVEVHDGDALVIEKKLGRAGMEALAPYLRDITRLQTLVLSGALGKDGVEVLFQALEMNTTVTALDLSNNNLQAEGARVVAELLTRCVCGCWGLFYLSIPLC